MVFCLNQWFWEAIQSFSPEEQGQFLKFVTSCSRPPLLGFERLNPPICVQRVPDGEEGRLPSSATCMNLLKVGTWAVGHGGQGYNSCLGRHLFCILIVYLFYFLSTSYSEAFFFFLRGFIFPPRRQPLVNYKFPRRDVVRLEPRGCRKLKRGN